MMPMVSIIIPTYNRANLIGYTLDSIIEQTYKNWECLVIDDGSSDNTSEVLAEIIEKDSRIKYFHRPKTIPKGPSPCRNYGFSLGKGNYVNFFDSDDIMLPNKLETEVEILNRTTFDFTICQTQFFDNNTNDKLGYWNNQLFSDDAINDFIMLKIGWSTNSPLWKRSSLEKHKLLFKENLMGPDDYDFHIQVLHLQLKPFIINNVHVLNRVHPDRIENLSTKSIAKSIIVSDLLENRKEYGLSTICINSQKKYAIYLIKNLYKNKNSIVALNLSKKLNNLFPEYFTKHRILKAFVIGYFFRISNRGYSLINKI